MKLKFLQLLEQLSEAHLHQISWYLDLFFGRYAYFFEGYRICQKSDKYWINQESLWLKGPQVGNMFTSVEVPKFGFEMIFKHDMKRVQGHLIEECSLHTFGTQDRDQDQTQDEDEV